jgi:hypothetical protein
VRTCCGDGAAVSISTSSKSSLALSTASFAAVMKQALASLALVVDRDSMLINGSVVMQAAACVHDTNHTTCTAALRAQTTSLYRLYRYR